MTIERRLLLGMIAASVVPLAGCMPTDKRSSSRTTADASSGSLIGVDYATPVYNEPYFVPGVRPGSLPEAFQRQRVVHQTGEAPGTIVIRTDSYFLYLIEPNGQAIRYGIGIGREGFGWKGRAIIGAKRKWPEWRPTRDMLDRDPRLKIFVGSTASVAAGAQNPLGARALYLHQNGRDTLYRIHGDIDATSIGSAVSSGCIRMLNIDVIDLYDRVAVGTKVVVI